MSTTITHLDEAVAPTVTRPATSPIEPAPRRGSLPRRWLRALLVLLGVIGAGVAAPATAQAAAPTTATVCFYLPNGGGFGANSAWTGRVNYQIHWNGTPLVTQSYAGSSSGCNTYYVNPGYYIRFQGAETFGSVKYSGTTAWRYATPGKNTYFGWNLVVRW